MTDTTAAIVTELLLEIVPVAADTVAIVTLIEDATTATTEATETETALATDTTTLDTNREITIILPATAEDIVLVLGPQEAADTK